LLAIAAVITPLGLYDGVYPALDLEDVVFVYVNDKSAISISTPARSKSLGFSRLCEEYLYLGQPDLGNVITVRISGVLNITVKERVILPDIL